MELDEVLASLDRRQELQQAASITTGSIGLDIALGGGWRKGRIAELSGDYSTYKTSFALHTVAQQSGWVLWLDSGSDFNPRHAQAVGVDMDKLVIGRPTDADEAMKQMRSWAGDCTLMVLDSASGVDCSYASDDWFEHWFSWLKDDLHSTVALFLTDYHATSDQLFTRELRKWSSQQVCLYPEDPGRVHAVVRKNPLARPQTHSIQFRFLRDASFDSEYELIRLALEFGVIAKQGSWLYFEGYQLGQGTNNTVRRCHDQPELTEAIRRQVLAATR